jgi:hypothetical protein
MLIIVLLTKSILIMKKFSLLLLLSVLVSFVASAQTPQPSYFTKAVITSILNQPGCVGIRVYPAIDSTSRANTTMVIGIDAKGKELYNSSSQNSEYQLFVSAENDAVVDEALNKSQAQYACGNYKATTAFVSDFTKAILQDFLADNSSGLFVSYTSKGGSNFNVHSYTTVGGLKSFGKAAAGAPCPRTCGDGIDYLCPPK